MPIIRNLIFSFFIVLPIIYAQEKSETIKIVGDSLVGKILNGESIREIYGNVVLTQGNILITCDEAVQYLVRNEARLNGNVVAIQDSLTITTSEGFYFGNKRRTKSTTGIILDDQKVILEADTGEYFFNEKRAFFQSNVTLFDSVMVLFSDDLNYYQKENRAIAVGSVKIVDASNEITADTLEHFRSTKISFAYGNVKIRSLENNTLIFGDHLEDYPEQKYSLVDENPMLMQFDTTYTASNEIEIDTLIIIASIMEALRDTSNIFKAIDSVKIVRGDFASLNDFTLYLRNRDIIITEKTSGEAQQPIIWYKNSQLTGDSITIYLKDKKITRLDVIDNSFMLSQSKNYEERYDQNSSKDINLFFADNKLRRARLLGSVFSIYYLYEEDEPNGLTKSSAKDVTIFFEDNKAGEVRMYGSPTSEYYPEKKVAGNEKAFTLPKFIYYKNRPTKLKLLKDKQ